jgi:hypothetical protein
MRVVSKRYSGVAGEHSWCREMLWDCKNRSRRFLPFASPAESSIRPKSACQFWPVPGMRGFAGLDTPPARAKVLNHMTQRHNAVAVKNLCGSESFLPNRLRRESHVRAKALEHFFDSMKKSILFFYVDDFVALKALSFNKFQDRSKRPQNKSLGVSNYNICIFLKPPHTVGSSATTSREDFVPLGTKLRLVDRRMLKQIPP